MMTRIIKYIILRFNFLPLDPVISGSNKNLAILICKLRCLSLPVVLRIPFSKVEKGIQVKVYLSGY